MWHLWMMFFNKVLRVFRVVIVACAAVTMQTMVFGSMPLSEDAIGYLLNKINKMQDQIQQLQGDIAEQNHHLEAIQQYSKKRYLDIDRRLAELTTTSEKQTTKESSHALIQTPLKKDKKPDKEAYDAALQLVYKKIL